MKIFGVDAETDGLLGPVWAIGAAIIDEKGNEIDHFCGQLDSKLVKDPWVIRNVVPVVQLPQYRSLRELCDEFWTFWLKYRSVVVCVADTKHPVEIGLFRSLLLDDPARIKFGPIPIHEVATARLLAQRSLNLDGIMVPGIEHATPHNPLDDARIAAHTFYQVDFLLHR